MPRPRIRQIPVFTMDQLRRMPDPTTLGRPAAGSIETRSEPLSSYPVE